MISDNHQISLLSHVIFCGLNGSNQIYRTHDQNERYKYSLTVWLAIANYRIYVTCRCCM